MRLVFDSFNFLQFRGQPIFNLLMVCFIGIGISSCRNNKTETSTQAELLQKADSVSKLNPRAADSIYVLVLGDTTVQRMNGNQVKALVALSSNAMNRGDLAQTLRYTDLALKQAEIQENWLLYSKIYQIKGSLYIKLGNNIVAEENLENALKYAKLAKHEEQEARVLVSMGSTQESKGDYLASIQSLQKGIELAQKIKDRALEYTALQNAALAYNRMKDHRTAVEYMTKSAQIMKEEKNMREYAYGIQNLGVFYKSMGKLDSALYFYAISDSMVKALNEPLGQLMVRFNIANIKEEQGRWKEAVSDMESILATCREQNIQAGIVYTLTSLGAMKGKYISPAIGLPLLNEALAQATSAGMVTDLPTINQEKIKVLSAAGLYKEAFELSEKNRALSDSLLNEQKSSEINKLRTSFENAQKELDIQLLQTKLSAEQEAKIQQQKILLLLAIVALLSILFSLYVWRLFKARTAAHRALLKIYSDKMMGVSKPVTANEETMESTPTVSTLSTSSPSKLLTEQPDSELNSEKSALSPLQQDHGPQASYPSPSTTTEQKNESILFKSENYFNELPPTLKKVLLEDKIYLDPYLSAESLADAARIPRRELSQLLNKHLGINFNKLILQCRIEHAMKLLSQPENRQLTIEQIGQQAGFLSRSAFYRSFTQQTGLPPAVFREGIQLLQPTEPIPQ